MVRFAHTGLALAKHKCADVCAAGLQCGVNSTCILQPRFDVVCPGLKSQELGAVPSFRSAAATPRYIALKALLCCIVYGCTWYLSGCQRVGGPARAASGGLAQGAWPTYLHPRLASTRALERFRNQARRRPLT